MAAEGIFHDAHEVWVVNGDERVWVATFASKALAAQFAASVKVIGAGEFEVVPV